MGRKIPQDAWMAEYVTIVVANMCSKLGPHNMDELDDARRSLIVSTMYVADVFYAYVLLRLYAMGNELPMKIKCPRPGCDVEFPYTADLNTLEVNVVDNIDDVIWKYELKDPIEIRNQIVTSFSMAYPKWNIMEQVKSGDSDAETKIATLLGSIIGLNESEEAVSLTNAEADELSKRDFEGLIKGIDDHYLGPKMSIEGECAPEVCTRFKRGGHKFQFPIDWRYGNFFAHSSR